MVWTTNKDVKSYADTDFYYLAQFEYYKDSLVLGGISNPSMTNISIDPYT